MAQRFDAESLKLVGEPFLAAAQVGLAGSAVAVSVSKTGIMVLSPDTNVGRGTQLAWFRRNGKPVGDVGPPGAYSDFSLAPDHKRVVVSRFEDRDLWLLDLATAGLTRFTFDAPTDRYPVWSPDSTRIVYARGLTYLYEKTVAGSGERQLMGVLGVPTDWSRDGRSILVRSNDGDIWALTDGKPLRITETQSSESQAQFSPDGKWIAFVSDESKRYEVYVQAFPTAGEKFPISIAGGTQPRWRPDGKELFYLAPDGKLMAAAVTAGAGLEHSAPAPLFDLFQITETAAIGFDYIVDTDGQRFLVRTPGKDPKSNPVIVTTSWSALVKR